LLTVGVQFAPAREDAPLNVYGQFDVRTERQEQLFDLRLGGRFV
jgi:hypothetical protein